MNPNIKRNPDPQAIAELLWHRFRLHDGKALTLVLNEIDRQDNRQALVHWVRRRLAHYWDCGVYRPLLELERELARRLIDSNLPGGELDVSAHYDETGIAPGESEPSRPAKQPSPRPGTSESRIIPFPRKCSS